MILKRVFQLGGEEEGEEEASVDEAKATAVKGDFSWYLRITPQQFEDIYGEAVDINLFLREPVDDEDLIRNFLPCKLWRLNNLYTVTDKDGVSVRFVMKFAQHQVYSASLQHPRLVILKSRQQGISTFWLVSFFDDGMFIDTLNIGLMAQGEDEASLLLERVDFAYDTFPEGLRGFLGIYRTRNNTKKTALSNGSSIFVRTSFRSATLQRLHISEFGKIANENPKRAKETKTGSLQAIRPGNTVIIESTAEGINEFSKMWDKAIESEARVDALGTGRYSGKDFKPIFLSWLFDPDCWSDVPELLTEENEDYFTALEAEVGLAIAPEQRWFWVAQHRELGDDIYQEYPATPKEAFAQLRDGSYYGRAYASKVVAGGRRVAGLYDSNLEVNVAMDLGMNDTFTLVYFQRYEGEWRVISEYTNTGEGLAHYVNHMKATGYRINWVICPHDIKVRELGTGVSRQHTLRKLGVTRIKVLPRLPVIDGIEVVRQILGNLWIDESCTYLDGCLRNYAHEWDDRQDTWKQAPLHNEWSHGADAIRYMATSQVRRKQRVDRKSKGSDFTVVDGLAF